MRSMKNRFAVGATAMALAVGVTAPAALAQTQVNQDLQVNQGTLISALNNTDANINDLVDVTRSLNDIDVRVVDVDNVANNNNVLNNALNRNDLDVDVLQDFLNDSINDNNVLGQALQNALQNADVEVRDVVAVDVQNGDVVVFVD
jgi:hypothetical protein